MSSIKELQKIVGSLLVVGFEGLELSASCRNFLEQWDLGGVILFRRNIQSLEQLQNLNAEIYRVSSKTPILSVDHEGGRVFRLPEPFTVFPPMRNLGNCCHELKDFSFAEEIGQAFGRELRAAGFNVDYAPVLDVDSNPQNPIIGDRAFASDPSQVTQVALSFLKGLQSEKVLGCGKHFPGHGDTFEDSHLTLPQVEKTREALENCEFIPFREAVRQRIPLLMTAHVMYPALDPELPATLSPQILQKLLREEMGYEGLIISDDFFMKGIAATWPLEEAAERFLRAGGDLVLLCHQEDHQRRIAAYLVHLAERDADFLDLLVEKSKRVEKFRKNLAFGVQEALPFVELSKKHQTLALKLK